VFTGTFMAENSQTLLRHILEAPYPNSSAVCSSYLSSFTFPTANPLIALILFANEACRYRALP